MISTRLAFAGALFALLLASACKDGRVGAVESEVQAMRSQVQQLQAQLAEQAGQQQRSEAQMVEWLDATSRQLDRFLDRIGAPPVDASVVPGVALPEAGVNAVTESEFPAPDDLSDAEASAAATLETTRPASVGPTALLVTMLLLAACAGIGFVALRTLRRDADPTAEPSVPAHLDDGHTKLLASLTEWEQQQQQPPAAATPAADATDANVDRGGDAVPIAAVHPETDDLETPAHHAGPAVVEPGAAAGPRETEGIVPGDEAPAEVQPAEAQAMAAEPAQDQLPDAPDESVDVTPASGVAVQQDPPAVPVRRPVLVEHEVPGRIAVDAPGSMRTAGPEPVRLPGPPRARFRAMTPSPEDAAVALAAILQIDPRVMRRPAPTVSTTPTTVVAEYSLVPALPPGERGDLEARLWQAVGEARKHGSRPLPSV